MTPQAYNAIRYDEKQSLWNNIEGRQLDVQFFHMGMGFRRRVRMMLSLISVLTKRSKLSALRSAGIRCGNPLKWHLKYILKFKINA